MSSIWFACNCLVLGLALLYISLYTITIPHRSLIYVRLLIAPLAILSFWEFGYGSFTPPTLMISSAMATVGMYGVMRVLEHSIVGFWDPTPPYWVVRAGNNAARIAYPLPKSFRARCFYALDLLTSQRGGSWLTDREWNWIPRYPSSWTPPSSKKFVVDGVKSILIEYLLLDLLDVITKSRRWDTTSRYPVSSLSVIEQSIIPMCICGGAFLSMRFGYDVTSITCVLCGSSPESWPPLFHSPFSSTSLGDFWANRWHWMFRRVFDRLSMPLMCITASIIRLGGKDVRLKELTAIRTIIRTIIIFWLSTLLHLFIMYRVGQPEYLKNYGIHGPPFWDADITMFFMAQPLGLLIESTVIIHMANWMFPWHKELGNSRYQTNPSVHPASRNITTEDLKTNQGRGGYCWQRVVFMRLYLWMFLIWTGRWGADKWVRSGFFHEDQMVVPFSLLRGLWGSKW